MKALFDKFRSKFTRPKSNSTKENVIMTNADSLKEKALKFFATVDALVNRCKDVEAANAALGAENNALREARLADAAIIEELQNAIADRDKFISDFLGLDTGGTMGAVV